MEPSWNKTILYSSDYDELRSTSINETTHFVEMLITADTSAQPNLKQNE